MRQKIKIGVFNQHDYAVKRNIYGKIFTHQVLYYSLDSYMRSFIHWLSERFHLDISWRMKPGILRFILFDQSVFYVRPKQWLAKDVDLVHTWNSVCRTSGLWGTTLETKLPHYVEPERGGICAIYRWLVRKRDLRLILSPNCRFLIALSNNTYEELQKSICKISKAAWKEINKKTYLLYPPQKRFITDKEIKEKFRQNKWNLIFVGGDFLVKGGMEMLSALKELRKHFEFTLTIVSTLNSYHEKKYYPAYSQLEIANMQKEIKTSLWITWYEKLEHSNILQLMRKSHIGIFPSYADTFGYVTLEMEACGCPVITTDINAFPEINNENIGWLINLKYDLNLYKQKGNEIRRYMHSQLFEIIKEIFQNRKMAEKKALAAAERIEKDFSPERFSEKIYAIYQEAIWEQNGRGQ